MKLCAGGGSTQHVQHSSWHKPLHNRHLIQIHTTSSKIITTMNRDTEDTMVVVVTCMLIKALLLSTFTISPSVFVSSGGSWLELPDPMVSEPD